MKENELFGFYERTTVNKQIDKIPVNILWDSFSINAEDQIKLIQANSILNTYFSIQNEIPVFTKKAFLMYVLWLSTECIPEKNQVDFKLYQEFLIDYLYDDMINREHIMKEKIILKNQLEKLEKEIEMDERFLKIASIKEQLKQAEAGVKQLNYKLVSKLQTTLDL